MHLRSKIDIISGVSGLKLLIARIVFIKYHLSMKICSGCKLERSESDFNYKNKQLNLRQRNCKYCTRQQVRQHYLSNKPYYLLKAKQRNTINRKLIKDYIAGYLKEHPCIDCGETDTIVLEFDHIKDKSFTISLSGRDLSLNRVILEVSKCVVRCANCHRRKTFKQFGWSKYMPS
jgi:hypothetical protein